MPAHARNWAQTAVNGPRHVSFFISSFFLLLIVIYI